MQPYQNQQQQQPYYNYQQQTPGPSQPQWQSTSPRRGWGDPRIQQPAQAVASPVSSYGPPPFPPLSGQNLPPPPANPQAPSRPDQTHRPQSPPSGPYDTSSWGVKYNQQQLPQQPFAQQQELRPPLPPRPSSAASGQYGGWPDPRQSTQAPPTPPPRPPQYSSHNQPTQPPQSQYYPHEQYSHQQPSHHYEPSTANWQSHQQQNFPSAPSWNQVQGTQETPVSPIEADHQRWSVSGPSQYYNQPYTSNQTHGHMQAPQQPSVANSFIPSTGTSALGHGTPSDWQHYHNADQQKPDHIQQQQSHTNDFDQGFVATPEQISSKPMQERLEPVRPPPMTPPPQASGASLQTQLQHSHLNSNASVPASTSIVDTQGYRQRLGSDSSASSISLPTRTGTIDSVIQAWNMPHTQISNVPSGGNNKISAHDFEPGVPSHFPAEPVKRVEMTNSESQTDFPPIVKTETKVETRVETCEIDPYMDIKDEYKTSLNRYANMLRQESTATSETEKMKIIYDFINRELKLRGALYSVDAPQLIAADELSKLREAAQTPTRDLRVPELNQTHAVELKNNDTKGQTPPQAPPVTTNLQTSSSATKDDSFVVVSNEDEDAEYSPGGRPRIAPLRTKMIQPENQAANSTNSNVNQPPVPQLRVQPSTSPSSNAPMTLEDYVMPDQPSPPWDAPIVVGPDDFPAASNNGPPPPPPPTAIGTPINFQPARPAYTPFRYEEASIGVPPLAPGQPANEAYAKLRHDQATDSSRLLSVETPVFPSADTPDRQQNETPSIAKQQQEEAFIGLLRRQSKAIRNSSSSPAPSNYVPPRMATPYRRASIPPLTKTVSTLRSLLPRQLPPITTTDAPHPKLVPILTSLSKIPDDFGFIHATVIAWDKENRQVRRKLDDERMARESENQARIDELFHDNEIGYSDIAGLEEDFKVEEASKKYQEDQNELDSFTTNVFDVVTSRLDSELNELGKLRTTTVDILDLKSTSAAQQIKTAAGSQQPDTETAPLSDTMDTLLQIFNKIDVRHTKIAEAKFEVERRRKRLELSVLYTNGDTAGVRKLEKDFDKAQALQVLAEARKRDERANKLMDSFDRAVVRGLAENQELVDDILNKTTLLRDLILGSESNGPSGQEREDLLYGDDGVKELMNSLQDTMSMLLQDSTTLVKTSNKADKILNEADFAIGLSEAQIARSDEKEFEKLRTEKGKEDVKLTEEFEGRLNGVTRVPDEISGMIKEVRDWIGGDKEHRSRIEKALQDAKMRNTPAPAPTG